MTTADKIAAALRVVAPGGKLVAGEVPLINKIAESFDARTPKKTGEPAWVVAARSKLGEKEIPGSKHNPWIVTFWQRLGAKWYNDDETPWCGGFIAWCLNEAGLPYPKNFPAAASFRDYGAECLPQLGAIGVKSRKGGNHVFIIVGETPDKKYFKALGGNQSDAVNIMDILKSEVTAIRWPLSVPHTDQKLPVLPAGKISGKES